MNQMYPFFVIIVFFLDASKFTYQFTKQVPLILTRWSPHIIEPFHEQLFQLIGNCLHDDNHLVRVEGYKGMDTLFQFQ
jgi:hypothetical protein